MSSCLRLSSLSAPRSSRSRAAIQKANWLARNVHRARPLPYDTNKGLGKFLPPQALTTLVDYQEGLLERLSNELRTDAAVEKHWTVAQTVLYHAKSREKSLAFNYASLALNNSFFLDQLAPIPEGKEDHEHLIPTDLLSKIEEHYGDLERLKSSFSATAMGMFSSGWVWLVTDSDGHLGILPTFGPSTLLVRSRSNLFYDNQPVFGEDPVLHAKAQEQGSLPALPSSNWSASPATSFGLGKPAQPQSSSSYHFGTRTYTTGVSDIINAKVTNTLFSAPTGPDAKPKAPFGLMDVPRKTLFPILCLSVYEHAWMSAEYGVWGKEPWLRQFWTVVDWKKVNAAYQRHLLAPST